ncbi:LbetaH domain-containing protein [Aquirufa nivalisilvae]
MHLSLEKDDLVHYTQAQLNHFYPDKKLVSFENLESSVDRVLDRLNFCFKHVAFNRYFDGEQTLFKHLYADHYVMYLWYLSNSIWKENENPELAAKLYYLNKSLHGFDCMYDTQLPDIFLIFHGVGTMLGKAAYQDFFVTLQGCTVGSHKGKYPKFGKGVALAANSSAIGNCELGNRSTISTRTTVFEKDVPEDFTAFTDFNLGLQHIKESKVCYAQQFFNVDLKKNDSN